MRQLHGDRTLPRVRAPATGRSHLTWLAAIPLALGVAHQAVAQEAAAHKGRVREGARQLEEVVVLANRREASLQDAAVSITALGGAALESRGITNFDSIKHAVSGLHLEVPANSSSSSIRIRGVGTAGNTGIDSSVGIIVDGVYQMFPGMAFTELMDVERVEVLRGPQGTLFGRNTTAGVIQIQTRDPVLDEFSGHLQGVLGNLDNRELRAMVNVPLVAETLALRVSANHVERDGYDRNTFLGRDSRGQDREGARFKLLWHPTDNLDLTWSSGFQRTETRLTEGLVRYGNDNILPPQHPLRGQPWQTLAGALGKTLPSVSLGRSAQNFEGIGDDEVERHQLTIDWALPGHRLRSVSAYEEFDIFIAQDRDRTVLDLSDLSADSGARVLTQEFVLSSEDDAPLSWLAGLFYQQEDLTTDIAMNDGADLIALRGGLVLPATTIVSDRNNRSAAAFGSLTYDFTPATRATVGVRYTEDTKDMRQVMNLPVIGAVSPMDGDKTFREWTWSAKLQHDLNADTMVYLAYDRGFKAGGFNQQNIACILSGGLQGCLSPDQLEIEPELTDSLELGLKSEWLDGRVRLNGALFYQTYDDYQVAEYLQEQAYLLVTNAAQVESMGIELDVSALLTDNLTLEASVAQVESEYDTFENAPCARPTQPGCSNGVQDLSGRRLDNAPRTTANMGLSWQAPVPGASGLSWFARGDAAYRSAANLYSVQDVQTRQGGYTLLSARLGLEADNGAWRATLWGNNLGDKQYAQTAISDISGVMMIRGLTRTYGLTLDWYF